MNYYRENRNLRAKQITYFVIKENSLSSCAKKTKELGLKYFKYYNIKEISAPTLEYRKRSQCLILKNECKGQDLSKKKDKLWVDY